MGYGGSAVTTLPNATYLKALKYGGTIVGLIGVTALDRVLLDPGGLGVDLGGSLRLPSDGYANWGVTVGTSGYGIRDNAGVIEFKPSGGAWAPMAAAAASAGGWTDDGTVVRLDTGTDVVSIGNATAAASRFSSSPVTGNTFNDNGDDIDFRIESDTNANHFISDAGAFSGAGAFGIGSGVSPFYHALFNSPALTLGAAASLGKVGIYNGGALTLGAGTAAVIASLWIDEPNIILGGNVVTDAYSLYIGSVPTEGVNNGAAWFKGQIRITSMPTAAAGLPSGTLWSNSGVVNVVP